MKNTDFFSSNLYIFLPTTKNPKVALVVDDARLSTNAFKLYNPFSSKAKLFKRVTKFCFRYLGLFLKPILAIKKEKSLFIKYLEEELHESLVVSLYYATTKDKVVMQIQTKDAKVLGYLKYPLNDIGLKHIKNEIEAFQILSEKNIVEPCIFSKEYDGKPFLLLKELDGVIDIVDKKDVDSILNKFNRDKSYQLKNHPRILELKRLLLKNDMQDYLLKVEEICTNSTISYKLVYEHGDFTPWNIVKVEDDYIPFDFEYFVEGGLEYFDIVKYYYQVGKLLEGKSGYDLVKFIKDKIDIVEIKELLVLFLIKEIVKNKDENEPFEFEESLLKLSYSIIILDI